jgi:hypothetical protein
MARYKEADIEDIREMEIRGPSRIEDHLTTLFSNKLLDPPITQVPITTPTSTQSSMHSRKHTRKFKSQQARDITVIKAKEQHRKQQEAKANRTSTSRTKIAEALAQMSQLLNGVELPFHSSQ